MKRPVWTLEMRMNEGCGNRPGALSGLTEGMRISVIDSADRMAQARRIPT